MDKDEWSNLVFALVAIFGIMLTTTGVLIVGHYVEKEYLENKKIDACVVGCNFSANNQDELVSDLCEEYCNTFFTKDIGEE